jgi:hypothetical protein
MSTRPFSVIAAATPDSAAINKSGRIGTKADRLETQWEASFAHRCRNLRPIRTLRRCRGKIRRALAFLFLVVAFAASTPIPTASAANLAVGMRIQIGQSHCSLGFFGFNAAKRRFAVTSGHCSDYPGQRVYAQGVEIGYVIARRQDGDGGRRIPHNGPRGFTLIALWDRFSLDPFFTDVGEVEVGDWVAKYGQRTGGTMGRVIGVTHDLDRPGYGVINSDVVVIGGDSGSPWFTVACSGCGPTLVGITSSGDQATRGGVEGDSQAQPIWDVIEMVRSSKWGVQFKVWVE